MTPDVHFITWETVTAFLLILGTLIGIWGRIETKINKSFDKLEALEEDVRKKLREVERDYANLRTHLAENYMDKPSIHAGNQQILRAMSDLRAEVKTDMVNLQTFLSQLISKGRV